MRLIANKKMTTDNFRAIFAEMCIVCCGRSSVIFTAFVQRSLHVEFIGKNVGEHKENIFYPFV